MSSRALVWLKRDLRLRDHAPLATAQVHDEALALFIVEPEWLASPECDVQHVAFALECLAPLREALAARGLPLWVRVGPAEAVLDDVRSRFAFDHLLSHEDTGAGWARARDRAVARWCAGRGVAWREWPQTGVLRHPPSPDGWALQWLARMNAVPVPMPIAFRSAPGLAPDALPALDSLCRGGAPRPLPGAGEAAAWELLRSFLDRSPRGDRRAPSIPATPQAGSSRLSAALAFGTISMRSVHQATERAIAATADRLLAHSLRAFGGRLRWHCHFLQQLEDEPAIEWRNVASAWDGVRAGDGSALGPHELECFEAWCEGRTGFPMVDAGMRSLRATGWLNFRMRALLVNVASHLLGLHWRETGLFLARQSLDFEPGIHWGQMQLQSGTTGTGLLRIDSPSKQAREHDPDGDFVRRWVPELGTPGYSVPIVDERAALAAAKARVIALHATPQVCAEAGGDPVPRRHGPGPSGLPPTGRRRRAAHRTPPATPQRDLFGDPSED